MGGRRARPTPWGWHQLDAGWAEQLVRTSGVGRGDLVLDIGAGHGALTAPLLDSGARVIAVELHPERVSHLRRRFGSSVTIVRADAHDLRLPRRPFHVVANPPFGATSDLLRRLVHGASRLEHAHLLVQRQAARRWAGPDAPGVGRWRRHLAAELGPPVPRSAFHPRPHVDSQLLILRRR